jgi:hypothetical protein
VAEGEGANPERPLCPTGVVQCRTDVNYALMPMFSQVGNFSNYTGGGVLPRRQVVVSSVLAEVDMSEVVRIANLQLGDSST